MWNPPRDVLRFLRRRSAPPSRTLDFFIPAGHSGMASPNMSDNDNVTLLGRLTVKEIHAKMNGSLVFSHAERQKKGWLVEHIVRDASPDHLAFLLEPATVPLARSPVALANAKERRPPTVGRTHTVTVSSTESQVPRSTAKTSMENFFHVPSEDKWTLDMLTFPEQLPIALVYPQVYMFKLFPKRRQGICDVSMLQRAVHGNLRL